MTTRPNGNGTKQYDEAVAFDSVQERAVGSETPLASYGTRFMGRDVDYFLFGYNDNRLPLSAWWSRQRDIELRQYIRKSTVLSGVTYGRTSAVKNMAWRIVAEDKALEPRIGKFHDMFQQSQFGDGFRKLLELYTLDNYTQDNGSFVELIGRGEESEQTDALGHRFTAKGKLDKNAIESFAILDAGQCYRTYNREWPVVYTNPYTGRLNILHWTRVIARSQFTQAYELGRGVGFCAASRAFQALEIIQASNDYIYEKMTGQSPEIAIVKGVAIRAIEAALSDNAIERDNKGLVRFKGIVFVPSDNMPNVEVGIEKIGVKDTPDGWDREKEMTLAIYMIAMAYATDPRDLGWPATQTGATKADAEMQDLKTSGRGRSDVLQDLEEALTGRILPPGLRFEFDIKDDLEDERKATIAKIRAETRAIQMSSGELNVMEARELAAREGDIDPAFLETQTVAQDDSNPTSDPDSPADDLEDVTLAEDEIVEGSEKAYNGDVRIPFQDKLLQVFLSDMNPFVMANEIEYLFTIYGQRAYLDGINDGGAKGIVEVSQLEPEERSELNGLIAQNTNYALGAAIGVQEATLEDKQNRAALWANKGLDSLYNAGLLAGNVNAAYIWKRGKTEKGCDDCKRYDGRVYRAKTWKKYNIEPRSELLACHGFNCDCTLEKTNLPIMRGRPPLPSGARVKSFMEKHSSIYHWLKHRNHAHD